MLLNTFSKTYIENLNNYKLIKKLDLKDKLLIVATGPSANLFWNNSSVQSKFKSYDILVMNDAIFELEEYFINIKPKIIALCDPMYFGVPLNSSRSVQQQCRFISRKVNNILKKIDWPVILITNWSGKVASCMKNPYITIVRLNRNKVNILNKVTCFLASKNLIHFGQNNVVHTALYFGIIAKYKKVALLGVEYNSIKYLNIDDNGIVSTVTTHCYDNLQKKSTITPTDILSYYKEYRENDSVVVSFLERTTESLKIFCLLRKFSEYSGECKIINYTPDSLVDSFERRKLVLTQKEI